MHLASKDSFFPLFCRSREIVVVDSEDDVVEKLTSNIQLIAENAINENGRFTLGLSGGSLVGFLKRGLSGIKTDWSKWVLAFCDERVVPFGDGESTFGAYVKALCQGGPLKEEQFIIIDPTLNGLYDTFLT